MELRRAISWLTPAGLILAIPVLFMLSWACSRRRPEAPAAAASSETPPTRAGITLAEPVRITMFYASPEHPAAGEKTLLCYGVENATEVRLEPAVDRVWPAPTRCVEAPGRAATYTLIASRGSEQVSQSLKVVPEPPKAMLFGISVNKLEIAPGDYALVCYNARNAVRVTVKPAVGGKPLGLGGGCVRDTPRESTTYVITATGAGGDTSSGRVTVQVRSGSGKP